MSSLNLKLKYSSKNISTSYPGYATVDYSRTSIWYFISNLIDVYLMIFKIQPVIHYDANFWHQFSYIAHLQHDKFFTAASPTQTRLGQRFRLIQVVIAQYEIAVRAHCTFSRAQSSISSRSARYTCSCNATIIIMILCYNNNNNSKADILRAIGFRRLMVM